MGIVLVMLALAAGMLALVAFGDRLFRSNRTRQSTRAVAAPTVVAQPDDHAVVWRTLVGAGQD